MPFYEYECSSCQHHVEVLQKISEAPLRKCPDCGKQALKRLISAPVFRLKGGGWYETDFKSDQEKKRNLAGGDDAGESKSDAKADSSSSSTKAESADAAKPKAESKPEKKVEVASKSAAKHRAPAAKAKPAKAKAAPKKKSARR
ncbi:MAG TPA: zinc ribbon domain-containing protein [Steroidobacteraceae bacterium]|jgi:putative FmdB family regulatory protein